VELFLIVNYKAYPQAFTTNGQLIAEAAHRLQPRLSKTRIILAVPAPLLHRLARVYDDLYLQHLDPVDPGARTGYIPARAIEWLPARGTLVNHSEHKLPYRDVAKVVDEVRGAGKEVVVCADTPGEAAGLAYLNPAAVAVEPPDLIGTGIPVSRARPEVITDAVEAVERTGIGVPVLAGAGITSGEDARVAVRLGARGVLVASAVVKNPRPGEKLEELAVALDTA